MPIEKPDILVVDDSRTIRVLMKNALEAADFSVLEADSGEVALSIISEGLPAAVLLDVEMMGINGFDTCAEIRRIPGGEYLPVMIITSLDDINSINKAYEVGATDFATKPVNWDLIGHRVRYMIRASQAIFSLKQAEEEVKKLNHQLEQKVIERTRQLKHANEDLQQTLDTLKTTQSQLVQAEKMASLGGLVSGVAHEVNTPIGVGITAMTHLNDAFINITRAYHENFMKRSDMEKFLATCEEAIRITLVNLNRSSELIESFKQVAADSQNEQRREFSIREYLKEIILSLQPALNKTELKLSLDVPMDVKVDSYPDILFQVINILVKNAILHAYEPDEPGKLNIRVDIENDLVVLRFQDDGKGMDPDEVKKVFEPFFTTARGAGHVGLGLHIAYNHVAQILGGNMACESAPKQGTTFIITFPLHAPKNKPVIASGL